MAFKISGTGSATWAKHFMVRFSAENVLFIFI